MDLGSGIQGSKRQRIRIRNTAWAASAGMWGEEGSQQLGWLVRLMRPRCATSTSRLASARGNTTTGLSAAKKTNESTIRRTATYQLPSVFRIRKPLEPLTGPSEDDSKQGCIQTNAPKNDH
jgi:hypothetical protein